MLAQSVRGTTFPAAACCAMITLGPLLAAVGERTSRMAGLPDPAPLSHCRQQLSPHSILTKGSACPQCCTCPGSTAPGIAVGGCAGCGGPFAAPSSASSCCSWPTPCWSPNWYSVVLLYSGSSLQCKPQLIAPRSALQTQCSLGCFGHLASPNSEPCVHVKTRGRRSPSAMAARTLAGQHGQSMVTAGQQAPERGDGAQ